MDTLDIIKNLFLLARNGKAGIDLYTKKPTDGEIDLFQSFNFAVGQMRLEVSCTLYGGGVFFYMVHARCAKGSLLLFVDNEWKNVSPESDVAVTIHEALDRLYAQVRKQLITELHVELQSTDCMVNPHTRPVRAPVGPIGLTIYEGNVEEML